MVSKRAKCLIVIFVYAAVILTSAVSNVFVKEVKAQETPIAKLQFEPSDLTVGVLGQDLPTPLTMINVTVANVTGLFAWQIKVYFDQSILRFEGKNPAVYPPADINIFGSLSHFFYNFTGTDAGGRYIQIAATLLPTAILPNGTVIYPSVNGSGVLTQLKFTGASSGSSHLNFSRPYGVDTLLMNITTNVNNIPIPADMVDAKVNVLGNGLSMVIQPDVLEIEASTNITGLIFPRQETSVVISYKLNGTDTEWKPLATVQTDRFYINETYYVTGFAYTWKPDKEGLYFVKAEGGGFVSQEQTLLVNPSTKPPPPNLWLLYGPPVAFAGAVIGGFFLWDRRRRHSSRMILP